MKESYYSYCFHMVMARGPVVTATLCVTLNESSNSVFLALILRCLNGFWEILHLVRWAKRDDFWMMIPEGGTFFESICMTSYTLNSWNYIRSSLRADSLV